MPGSHWGAYNTPQTPAELIEGYVAPQGLSQTPRKCLAKGLCCKYSSKLVNIHYAEPTGLVTQQCCPQHFPQNNMSTLILPIATLLWLLLCYH